MDIESLQRQAQSGSKEAELKLFKSLTVRFKLLAQQRIRNEEDCEEVVQTTLAAIAGKYKKTNFKTSFGAWAYAIFENTVKNYYRARKYHLSKMGRLARESKPPETIIPNPGMKQKLIECLKKVGRRNIRYARILNYHYQGYTGHEIGKKLKVTRSNAYVIFTRAREMLKKCLDDEDFQ